MSARELTDDDKELLLQLARESIANRLAGDTTPLPEDAPARLYELGSCFVTLHLGGGLRGCIGDLEARCPLIESVHRNALSAAFDDPRFPPVARSELAGLHIEISCLTPPEPIAGPEEFEVGRHGIILAKEGRRAVFLPQVAPEWGWDRETTLTHLARKAGLAPDAWRQGASFEVFEAVVFEEA